MSSLSLFQSQNGLILTWKPLSLNSEDNDEFQSQNGLILTNNNEQKW